MVERRCRYCERIFQPSKYQPAQSVCSEPGCQGRRRADYHRQKIAADPEYQRCAWTVRRSGALGTRITGSAIASSTGLLSNGIVRGSTFETKSGVCAIWQTTTQFSI
jgi:hypothetical protein